MCYSSVSAAHRAKQILDSGLVRMAVYNRVLPLTFLAEMTWSPELCIYISRFLNLEDTTNPKMLLTKIRYFYKYETSDLLRIVSRYTLRYVDRSERSIQFLLSYHALWEALTLPQYPQIPKHYMRMEYNIKNSIINLYTEVGHTFRKGEYYWLFENYTLEQLLQILSIKYSSLKIRCLALIGISIGHIDNGCPLVDKIVADYLIPILSGVDVYSIRFEVRQLVIKLFQSPSHRYILSDLYGLECLRGLQELYPYWVVSGLEPFNPLKRIGICDIFYICAMTGNIEMLNKIKDSEPKIDQFGLHKYDYISRFEGGFGHLVSVLKVMYGYVKIHEDIQEQGSPELILKFMGKFIDMYNLLKIVSRGYRFYTTLVYDPKWGQQVRMMLLERISKNIWPRYDFENGDLIVRDLLSDPTAAKYCHDKEFCYNIKSILLNTPVYEASYDIFEYFKTLDYMPKFTCKQNRYLSFLTRTGGYYEIGYYIYQKYMGSSEKMKLSLLLSRGYTGLIRSLERRLLVKTDIFSHFCDFAKLFKIECCQILLERDVKEVISNKNILDCSYQAIKNGWMETVRVLLNPKIMESRFEGGVIRVYIKFECEDEILDYLRGVGVKVIMVPRDNWRSELRNICLRWLK